MGNYEHKFKSTDGGASSYSCRVFCEYCGLIAFDADNPRSTLDGQKTAKKPCPRHPKWPLRIQD